MGDGDFFLHGMARSCQRLSEIEAQMAQPRTYINVSSSFIAFIALFRFLTKEPTDKESIELQLARTYNTRFEEIFVEGPPPAAVQTDREFGAFFNILRYYHPDSRRTRTDTSSSLKASNFKVYFISPPFFSCPSERFTYKE
jgi:hypothetical protein